MMSNLRTAPLLLASAAVLALPASVAAFATIPEDEVFAREGRRESIHIRIQDGCDDAATDRVEVEIPESVLGVVPEEVPGWTATTETVETEPYELFDEQQTERVATIVWTGGPLAPGMFQDFGITAVFTEPTDELVLPVVQGCGEVERAWVEVAGPDEERSELPMPAPVVRVIEPVELSELDAGLREVRADLKELQTSVDDLRLGEIGGSRLRDRLRDAERRLDQLEDEVDRAQASNQ